MEVAQMAVTVEELWDDKTDTLNTAAARRWLSERLGIEPGDITPEDVVKGAEEGKFDGNRERVHDGDDDFEVMMVEKDNNVKVASAMLHLSAAQALLANVRDKGELPAHSAMWAAVSLACERARAAADVLGEALTLRLEED